MVILFKEKQLSNLQVLNDPAARAMGFQYATPEEINSTILLFDFGEAVEDSFHMGNVAAPLDIAFLDADNVIIEIKRMEPGPDTYSCSTPFVKAVEAGAGYFRDMGLGPGDKFDIHA